MAGPPPKRSATSAPSLIWRSLAATMEAGTGATAV